MIYRIFPSKDTWITNLVRQFPTIPVTGSNFGASEILDLFKKAGVSGALGWNGSSSLGRVLMQFDMSPFQDLTASLQAPVHPQWRLHLSDVRHAETLPSSYDIEVLSITTPWDEGPGFDEETFVDLAEANWDKAKKNLWWNTPGGDTDTTMIAKFHVDQGPENVDVVVTDQIERWLGINALPVFPVDNNGFMVRVSSSQEVDSFDYFVKKFYSRTTNNLDRRPYLEARWDDSIRDDRSNFVFDYSGTLYLYNEVRGALTNIPGVTPGPNCLTVRLEDLSGTLLTTSASWTGMTGIYSCSLMLPTGSYSGSLFSDIWYLGSRAYMTGNFRPTDGFSQPTLSPGRYEVEMPNLKNEYTVDELADLRVFVRPFDFNPPVVNTGSVTPVGTIINRGYYRIDNDRTKEQVVPFGTGSYQGGTDWTRLSYDGNGNYFDFHMSSLAPGNVYRVVLLFDQDGRRQIVDRGFKFRIV
jgi:hypothetical protein